MSNIAFKNGDYNQQKNIVETTYQDGLIYFNPENRTLVIGESHGYANFNPIMVNDNQQVSNLSNYLNSSSYILNNKILVDDNSTYYYSVNKANNIIGTTNTSMTNGYITKNLKELIDGIPYESEFTYKEPYIYRPDVDEPSSYAFTVNVLEYTFKFPSDYSHQINKSKFTYLIIFYYDRHINDNVGRCENFVRIYPVKNNNDIILKFIRYGEFGIESSMEEFPNVYKAFWI